MEEPTSNDSTVPAGKAKRRDLVLPVMRVNAEEQQIILTKAAQAGMKPTAYIREAALGKEIVEKVPPAIRQYIGSVANNVNQLTRLANSGKLNTSSAEHLDQLVKALLLLLKPKKTPQ